VDEDRSRESADEPSAADVQDEIPPEWIRMREREAALRRARHEHRLSVASWLVPVIVLGTFAIVAAVVAAMTRSTAPAPSIPSQVQAFARTLPASRAPDSLGVTVVDAEDAPNTWRIAWETRDEAFCFAFVHESAPPQTVCDAPGSVPADPLRIVGELEDEGLDPPELFGCGYALGGGDYVSVDDDAVIGTLTGMGSSELSAYCVQLPDGVAPGASFTVSTVVIVGHGSDPEKVPWAEMTATYP
jgi:hypothetical protein